MTFLYNCHVPAANNYQFYIMKTKLFITAAICLFIFISCNRNNNAPELSKKDIATDQSLNLTESDTQKTGQPIPLQKQHPPFKDSANTTSGATTPAYIDWDKKIIKTATVKIEVKDFKSYNDNFHKTLKQYGAYIAQEDQSITNERSENVVAIKVPVEQFENLMNQLTGSNDKVVEKKITTDDVTSEVVDTKSRLEAKKEMRQKYLEFLKASKNMEEVIQVQNEINNIQEQMESATGRVNYLSHEALYSTINITFFQPVDGFKPTDENPSFFTRVVHAFTTGGSWIADLFVGLISIWPLWLGISVCIIGWKKIKSSKKNTVSETQQLHL